MSSNPSPTLAALLSFIFPGLGQVYAGDIRRGLVWTIPMLVIILAVLFLVLGGSGAFLSLLTAQKTLALIVFNVAFFLYHVAATLDAYDAARRERALSYSRRGSGTGPIVLAGLIALTMLIHGLPTMYAADYYSFVASLPGNNGGSGVIPSFDPGTPLPTTPTPLSTATPLATVDPSASPDASETPDGTPTGSGAPSTPQAKVCPPVPGDLASWGPAQDGRVNIMLVGSDSRSDDGVSPASLRTDSMMLMSVDIAACKAAVFSFPRNLTSDPGAESRYPDWFRIPLSNGQAYGGYLFALWRDAASNPSFNDASPGIGPECQRMFSCARGWFALTDAIQNMAGVQVDAVVAVNLKGFVDVVDALPGRGVWIDIPEPLFDDKYHNSRQELMVVDFDRGCQFLNGEETLAYARSRRQDSDYQRARRQQYVLQQVRKQLDPIGMLPSIPGLLDAARENLFMSISDTDIPFLAQVASRIDADRLYRYDFAPARLNALGSMQGMRDKVQNIFDEPEPEPEENPGGEPCPPR